ncbi:hypothetical protein KOXY103107_10330 [Komagataeibacter xylinus]
MSEESLGEGYSPDLPDVNRFHNGYRCRSQVS